MRTFAPYVLIALLAGAAAFAFFRSDRSAEQPPQAIESTPTARPEAPPGTVPLPQRPPMPPPAREAREQNQEAMGVENEEPAAFTWKVPASWQPAPNPNPMRIATYHVAAGDDGTEVTISRAGGSAEANIERWVGQFEGASQPKRSDRTIRGVPVAVVEVTGNYNGGAMMPGMPSSSHDGWTLVGAIAQPKDGATYFFKLLGPAAKVAEARSSFDTFLASLTPR